MHEKIDADESETARDSLRQEIQSVELTELGPAAKFVADNLSERFPGCAILFYGSGNSVSADENPTELLFDFYVVGETYNAIYNSSALRGANRLVPPNVFYWEKESPHGRLRAKYAVLSLQHFEKLVSPETFHSYFWARFAQPTRIVVAPLDMKNAIVDCLVQAISTFCVAAAGLMPQHFDADDLWRAGLAASYRAELRAESPQRTQKLVESYGDWQLRVTAPALRAAGLQCTQSAEGQLELVRMAKRSGISWRLRSIIGGGLSIMRLLKSTQTFEGGIDYIAWKIRRHSGIEVPVKEWERRHSLVAAPIVAFRYYRLRSKQHKGSHRR